MQVITRAQWGGPSSFYRADGGGLGAFPRPMSQVDTLMVHWEGVGSYLGNDPASAMRAVQRAHMSVEGGSWGGIGYNFTVFADGSIYEGRGWDLTAVACPNYNGRAIHVQAHLGTTDPGPTPAMLAAIRALAEEADRRAGRSLTRCGHRDRYPTECPGNALHSWVHSGMPTTTTLTDEDDDMAARTDDEIRTLMQEAILRIHWGDLHYGDLLLGLHQNTAALVAREEAQTAAITALAQSKGVGDVQPVLDAIKTAGEQAAGRYAEVLAKSLNGASITLNTDGKVAA